ncbi:hypothetical protein ACN2WE_40885 [Streptomyces sp. cg28]|uniref:hypothetical protein n=1 Tax=Streptomyces sp. cg28 TaxID=3403457 RepID=UPI003B20D452
MPRRPTPLSPDDGPQAQFALALRQLRDQAGFDAKSIQSIAAENHMPKSTLWAALRGERMPTLPVLGALVRAWGGDEREWTRRRSETEDAVERDRRHLALQRDDRQEERLERRRLTEGRDERDWRQVNHDLGSQFQNRLAAEVEAERERLRAELRLLLDGPPDERSEGDERRESGQATDNLPVLRGQLDAHDRAARELVEEELSRLRAAQERRRVAMEQMLEERASQLFISAQARDAREQAQADPDGEADSWWVMGGSRSGPEEPEDGNAWGDGVPMERDQISLLGAAEAAGEIVPWSEEAQQASWRRTVSDMWGRLPRGEVLELLMRGPYRIQMLQAVRHLAGAPSVRQIALEVDVPQGSVSKVLRGNLLMPHEMQEKVVIGLIGMLDKARLGTASSPDAPGERP